MTKARTKALIIQAAIKVISEKGYDKSTVESILAEAKVSKGTFYRYFKSKRDLLDRACREFLLTTGGEWDDFVGGIDDPIKGLEYYVDLISSIMREEKSASTYFELWARGVRSEIHKKPLSMKARPLLPGAGIYRQLHKGLTRFYKMGIEKGIINETIDPGKYSTIFLAAIDGLCMLCLLNPEEVKSKEACELIKKIFIYDLIQPNPS